jgi:hypothetical protein
MTFKNIKQLEEEIEELRKENSEGDGLVTMELKDRLDQTKGIIKIINEDIKFQKSQLKKDFEKDKPIQWRITGFESLKQKLNGNTKSTA